MCRGNVTKLKKANQTVHKIFALIIKKPKSKQTIKQGRGNGRNMASFQHQLVASDLLRTDRTTAAIN